MCSNWLFKSYFIVLNLFCYVWLYFVLLCQIITLSLRFCCKFTRNSFQYFSKTSSFWLMNYWLSALSARIYPIVDFEVVGTLIYNGLSGFALKKLWSKLSSTYFFIIIFFKQKREFWCMVCSCGVVSKGCCVHVTWRACILGWILGSSVPLGGCGQFGRMLVAMSTGDQSSHWRIFKLASAIRIERKFLLTERVIHTVYVYTMCL